MADGGEMVDGVELDAIIEGERQRLSGEILDLSEELDAIVESAMAGVPDDEHDAEGSTIGYERARVQALLEHARGRLRQLDAVTTLPPGRPRRCESCGVTIPMERLMALPSTRSCTACASRSI